MAFQPEEVSSIIQQQLEKHDTTLEMESVGAILQIGDGIVRIWGLQEAMAGELLEFPGGVMGMVLNLEEDNVGAVLFGSDVGIKEGDPVKRTGTVASGAGRRSASWAAWSTRWDSPSTVRVPS